MFRPHREAIGYCGVSVPAFRVEVHRHEECHRFREIFSGNADSTSHPTQTDLSLRLAVISDWGPIIDRPYKPLNDTLDYILSQRQNERKNESEGHEWRINGMLLNGDYAYELETTHCYRYVLFLHEISRITRFWPIMATFGNHESTLPKSYYLFDESF